MSEHGMVLVDDIGLANEYMAKLRTERDQLREALEQCEEYFDDRADCDLIGDPPRKQYNAEARLLDTVRRALGK